MKTFKDFISRWNEALTKKIVYRAGKKVIKKVTNKDGYKVVKVDGKEKEVKMDAKEKMKRKKGAKFAAKKRKSQSA